MADKYINLDANESVYFNRQLEHTKKKSYDKIFPEFTAKVRFPFNGDVDEGAESIIYHQFTEVGMGKIISDYADDLPRCDVYGKEFSSFVRTIGQSYGYTIMDVKKSALTGKALPQRKANAARRGNDQKLEDLAWNGSEVDNILGVFSNPNISSYTAANGASPISPLWGGKTPTEIIKDMNDGVTYIVDLTNGVEQPDTIVLPIKQYSQIATTNMGAGTDTTILSYFKATNPLIKTVTWDIHCKDVAPLPSGGAGPSDVMFIYKNDIDKLSLEIPLMYKQLSPEPRNLEFVINTYSRCGGVIIYYPLSVLVVEGI